MKITITHARANLRALWDGIERTGRPVIVQRRGHADMALLPADELARLQHEVRAMSLALLGRDFEEDSERGRGLRPELLKRLKVIAAGVRIGHDAPMGEVETANDEEFERMQDPKVWAKTKRAFKADLGQGRPRLRSPRTPPRNGNA